MQSDNPLELLPIVDEAGKVIGSATRQKCHDGSLILHPVVHLHLLSDDGKLYLQLRPTWKTIQPGKWDTAVGGHIGYGEDVEDALHRETFEELGLRHICAKKVTEYTFRTNVDAEYVHVYIGVSSDTVVPSEETAGGRFWSFEEIEQNIGKGLFTPNFEDEYRMLRDNGDFDGFICNLTTDATS